MMGKYLTKTKTLCGLLDVAGHKITDVDQVLTILSGPDDDYEAIVTMLSFQSVTPSLQQVHSLH